MDLKFNHYRELYTADLKICSQLAQLKNTNDRVRQLACVEYVHTPNFIGVRIILDMRKLTRMLIFFPTIFKVFKIFLVLIILNCLKTYCYIFDWSSLIYNTSARHERHECDMSVTRATWVQHEWH